jgi:hypothetical protein
VVSLEKKRFRKEKGITKKKKTKNIKENKNKNIKNI